MQPLAPVRVVTLYGHHDARQHGLDLGVGDCLATEGHLTFTELFERLRVPRGRRYAGQLMRRLLIRGLLRSAPPGGRWPRADARTVCAAQRAVDELRAAGITARHFDTSPPSDALSSLLDLLTAYEEKLDVLGWEDDADQQREVVLAAGQGKLPLPYHAIERVIVRDGGDLFGARLDLLSALAARGVDVEVNVPFDPERRDGFAWPEATLHAIERRGHDDIRVALDRRIGDGPLRAVRAAQMTDQVAREAPVMLLAATHPAEHSRQVAAAVAAWVLQGVAPDRIAVATADVDGLGAQIVRALRRVGIAARSRRGATLADGPLVRAVVEAFRLEAQGFVREPFLDVWRHLGGSVESSAGRPISAHRVARLVRASGARSAKIHDYAALLRRWAHAHTRRHPDPEREAEAARVGRALDDFARRLRDLPVAGSVAEMAAAARGLLRAAQPAPALHRDVTPATRGVLESQSRARRSREGLVGLLVAFEQAARVLPAALTGGMEREELADWLEVLAREVRLDPVGLRAGSVVVGSMAQLVGCRYDRVMLAGIDAGSFPRLLPDDVILSEPLRQEINRRLGPRLMQRSPMEGRGEISAHARDRWLWLEGLAAARDRLAVSFSVNPSSDNEGLSELIEELGRSIGVDPVAPGEPAYAVERPVATSHALAMWSFGALSDGARVATVRSAAHAAALGAVLTERYPARARRVVARIDAERAVASERRRIADLDVPRRAWLRRWVVKRTHSPSRLDRLGECAFRFFAQTVLRLEREQLEALGADPREEGSVAHAALERVYDDIRLHGGLAAARANPERARARAREVFETARDHVLAEAMIHPTLVDAVLADAWRAVLVQLSVDLEASDELDVTALELSFADQSADLPALLVEHPAGGAAVRVRGTVDRVDRSDTRLRILDYKRTIRLRPEGRHFQLPLYAAAVLPRYEAPAVEMGWAGLKNGRRVTVVLPDDSPRAVVEMLRASLWQRLDRILSGDVSPDPVGGGCDTCDVRGLCRRDASRDELRESRDGT